MAMESERVVYNPLMVGGGTPYTGGAPVGGFGFGSGGILEGLILGAILRNGNGLFGNNGADGVAGTTVLEQNVSELRKDVAGVNTSVEALGNELQAAIFNQTSAQTAQFNNISNLIMSGSKETALLAKDAIIAGMVNTQSIKDQASAFQVINQENFCAVKEAIHADGDATRALITTNLIDGLRAELAGERRGRDQREIEITVTQSNNQLQAQFQQQQQQQTQFFANALNMLGDQINRQTNSIVNLGSGAVVSPQSNTAANNKVNS